MRLIDVEHLGRERVIGCWEVDGALVDPGPESSLHTVLEKLGDQVPRRGRSDDDVDRSQVRRRDQQATDDRLVGGGAGSGAGGDRVDRQPVRDGVREGQDRGRLTVVGDDRREQRELADGRGRGRRGGDDAGVLFDERFVAGKERRQRFGFRRCGSHAQRQSERCRHYSKHHQSPHAETFPEY